MPPATSSWSTPVTGVQALQIDNKHPQPSNRVDGADLEGRKRRKITPISSVSKPENTVLLEDEQSEHALDKAASAGTGTWDYLAKWETEDSAVIEDIPEADEEEYLSDVSDDSPGALEDQGHESDGGENLPPGGSIRKPSKLGEERVTEIVNECIETYANAWKPGKGETKHKGEDGKTEVPVVYDAVALWEEAEAAGQREELAAKYESEADYYRDRLDTLCEEISMDPGDTVAGIKMKCRNLEVTVEIIERAEWLASIYRLPPADSSEDESQDQHSVLPSEVQPPAIQPLRYTQHTSASQVIDLGTPSDTSDSEGEDPLPSDTPTTPALLNSSSKQEMIPQDRLVTSDPVVVDTIETPRPTVVAPTPTVIRSRVPLGDAPEHASIVTVSRWSWSRLKDTHDRKRAVSKAIYELSSADREIIRQRLWQVGRANMVREIPACVGMLLHGEKKMPGILPQDLPKIVTFTRLFLCWWSCGNYLVENPSEDHLEELADCLRQSSPDPASFCDYVDTILGTTFSLEALSKPTQPSQAEIIEISDDDEPAPRVSYTRKNNLYKPGSLQKTPAIIID